MKFRNIGLTYKITITVGLIIIIGFSSIFIYFYYFGRDPIKVLIDKDLVNTTKICKDVLQRSYDSKIMPLIAVTDVNYQLIKFYYNEVELGKLTKSLAYNTLVSLFSDKDFTQHCTNKYDSLYSSNFTIEFFVDKNQLDSCNHVLWEKIAKVGDTLIENYSCNRNDNKIGKFKYFKPWNIIIGTTIKISLFDSLAIHCEEFRRPIVDLSFGTEKITENNLDSTGYFWIINDSHISIMHPKTDFQGNYQDYPHLDSMINQYKRGIDSVCIMDYRWANFADTLLKRASYIGFEKLNWILSGGYYQHYIYKPVYDLTSFVIYISLFTLVLSLILIYFFTKRLLRPLRKLAHHVKKLGEGEYSSTFDLNIKDEVGTLSSEFNIMSRKIKNHTEDLEEKVKEALEKQKHQQELLVQQAALNGLGKLSNGIAHELRQPLQVIKTDNTTLFENTNSNSETDKTALIECLNRINQSVDLMSRIIENINLLKTKQNDSIKEFFCVNEWIRKTFSLIGHRLASHGIKLNIDFGGIDMKLEGNPFKFQQVMINILFNSLEALDEKQSKQNDLKKVIEVSTCQANEKIVVKVFDNGIGIKTENLSRILDWDFTTKDLGTGLGLTLSKDYLKEMNGYLKFESKYNEGTTVSIIFPLNQKL